jgi:hypothetical protein
MIRRSRKLNQYLFRIAGVGTREDFKDLLGVSLS